MTYLIVRQKVKDYYKWVEIFTSHRQAHSAAGLTNLRLMRDISDPDLITCMFDVEDVGKALAFTTSDDSNQAQADSGIIGDPEVYWLKDK
jgi:hypothetical protein